MVHAFSVICDELANATTFAFTTFKRNSPASVVPEASSYFPTAIIVSVVELEIREDLLAKPWFTETFIVGASAMAFTASAETFTSYSIMAFVTKASTSYSTGVFAKSSPMASTFVGTADRLDSKQRLLSGGFPHVQA